MPRSYDELLDGQLTILPATKFYFSKNLNSGLDMLKGPTSNHTMDAIMYVTSRNLVLVTGDRQFKACTNDLADGRTPK